MSPRQLGLWKQVLAQVRWLLLPYVLSRHGMQEEERDCESEKTGPFSHPCLICLQVHRANPQVEKYIADGTFQKETASCSKAFRNIRKRQPMSFGQRADLKTKTRKLPGPMKSNLANISSNEDLKKRGL